MNLTKLELEALKKYYNVKYNRGRGGYWYLYSKEHDVEIDVEIFGNKEKKLSLKSADVGSLSQYPDIQDKVIDFILKNINEPMDFFRTLVEFKNLKISPFESNKYVISKHGNIYEDAFAMEMFYNFSDDVKDDVMRVGKITTKEKRAERAKIIFTNNEFSSWVPRYIAPPQPILESYVEFFKVIKGVL